MKTTFGEESNVLFNFFYRSSLFQFDAFFYGLLIPLLKINKKYILYMGYFISLFAMFASQSYNAHILSKELHVGFWDALHTPEVIYSNGQFAYMNTLYNVFWFFFNLYNDTSATIFLK
jgi:hypothetical protein